MLYQKSNLLRMWPLVDPASKNQKIAYVTQTTLSMNDTKNIINVLKKRFPDIQGPDLDDICYATQNRQAAVSDLAEISDIVFVVGGENSSNTKRLADEFTKCAGQLLCTGVC